MLSQALAGVDEVLCLRWQWIFLLWASHCSVLFWSFDALLLLDSPPSPPNSAGRVVYVQSSASSGERVLVYV